MRKLIFLERVLNDKCGNKLKLLWTNPAKGFCGDNTFCCILEDKLIFKGVCILFMVNGKLWIQWKQVYPMLKNE